MKQQYPDLLKFGEPVWYDDNGTPRFREFDPELLDPYIEVAIYGTVICQHCHKEFKVGIGFREEQFQRILNSKLGLEYVYGDPPAHSCVGATMTSTFLLEKTFVNNYKTLYKWKWQEPNK